MTKVHELKSSELYFFCENDFGYSYLNESIPIPCRIDCRIGYRWRPCLCTGRYILLVFRDVSAIFGFVSIVAASTGMSKNHDRFSLMLYLVALDIMLSILLI